QSFKYRPPAVARLHHSIDQLIPPPNAWGQLWRKHKSRRRAERGDRGQRAVSYNSSLCRATVTFGSSRNPAKSHWIVDEAAPGALRDRLIMDCLCAAPTRNAALLNEACRQCFSMFFIIPLSRSSLVLSHRS